MLSGFFKIFVAAIAVIFWFFAIIFFYQYENSLAKTAQPIEPIFVIMLAVISIATFMFSKYLSSFDDE